MVLLEQIAWTRDILERLYDIPYLRHALDSTPAGISFRDARDLQARIIDQIQVLKPPPEVASSSLAWRLYNALDLRYVRGITQSEAASELNISLRQLRREQDRGIEAIASLLMSDEPRIHTSDNPLVAANTSQPASIGEREYMRLDDLLHSVLTLIDPFLTEKNVDVQVRIPVPAPVFWTNRTAVRQLLIMLVSMMIRDASGGTLEVNGVVSGDWLKLALCTNHLVVTPITNSCDNTAANDHETLSKLADDSGISIHFDLQAADNTEIDLLVPMSGRQRVLFVDDNTDNLALTERYLSKSPYDLITVSRAEDALIQAQILQPSCIVLDVMMPGHDGWEILALLKSYPETMHIPVVVCSVLRNSELARALGATATLSRPHTANQLLETLHTAIALSHQPQVTRSV